MVQSVKDFCSMSDIIVLVLVKVEDKIEYFMQVLRYNSIAIKLYEDTNLARTVYVQNDTIIFLVCITEMHECPSSINLTSECK